jgi:hypothetical protein
LRSTATIQQALRFIDNYRDSFQDHGVSLNADYH